MFIIPDWMQMIDVNCKPNGCKWRSDLSFFSLSFSLSLFSAFLRPKLGKQYEASCVVSFLVIL